MTDSTRPAIKGFDLPKQKPINKYGNSTLYRQPIPCLQRTIRDAQAIAKRHKDDADQTIVKTATALVEMCRASVQLYQVKS